MANASGLIYHPKRTNFRIGSPAVTRTPSSVHRIMASLVRRLPASPYARMRLAAFSVYGFVALVSLLWGLSYDLWLNAEIGADVRLGATREGSTFIAVRNGSGIDWTNVKFSADGAYFFRLESLPAGGQTDARLREFENEYRLPRPNGLFPWESVGIPPESFGAPTDYRPSTITISCDEGEFVSNVAL